MHLPYRGIREVIMKTKFCSTGMLIILIAFSAIILGVVISNVKNSTAVSQNSVPENISTAQDTPDAVSVSAQTLAVSANSISANAVAELQSSFAEIVERYNSLAEDFKKNKLDENEELSEVFKQAAQLLTEMSEVDLNTISDDQFHDLCESVDAMALVLDQIELLVNPDTGA